MSESSHNSVLFVCTGNTCRSTTSEALLRNMLTERNEHSGWLVDSAALMNWQVGRPVDRRALAILKKNGISDYTHTARQITIEDFYKFKYILCMDEWHLENLLHYKPSDSNCVIGLLGSYDKTENQPEISDPFIDRRDIFEPVFHKIVRSCSALLEHIVHSGSESAQPSTSRST